MVHVYQCASDGSTEKMGDTNYFTSKETVEKNMTNLNDGSWKSLHGLKLLVGEDNTVIRGPDSLVGRNWDEVKMLSYSDVFSVMRNEHQMEELVQKSLLLGVNQLPGGSYTAQIDKMQKEKSKSE